MIMTRGQNLIILLVSAQTMATLWVLIRRSITPQINRLHLCRTLKRETFFMDRGILNIMNFMILLRKKQNGNLLKDSQSFYSLILRENLLNLRLTQCWKTANPLILIHVGTKIGSKCY